MSKIFGISNLPVAKAFPSLEFGAQNSVPKPYLEKIGQIAKQNFVTKPQSKPFLKKLFNLMLKK